MNNLWQTLGVFFQSHPWHGVALEPSGEAITAFVEVTAADTMKYELDKVTGLLRLDRPQKFSSVCPTLYGFVPQTLCASRIAERAGKKTGQSDLLGDADPLDICILSERHVDQRGVLVDAIPIGGLRMIDGGEADDKIIAVLAGDATYGALTDITQCPAGLLDRLRHYFLTYKQSPDRARRVCEIAEVYDAAEAREVIRLSHQDYLEQFAGLHGLIETALGGK